MLHAGRYLNDREIRYLRTLIVKAYVFKDYINYKYWLHINSKL